MNSSQRSSMAFGLLLVLAGGLFLAAQFYAPFGAWVEANLAWPWIIIGVGAAMLLLGLIFRQPDLIVSACVVGGVGGLLYWQNSTGNWDSWAYAWALIPGFAGIGNLLSSPFRSSPRKSITEGIDSLVASAVLFTIFSSFLGGRNLLGAYWPLALVGAGLLLILRSLVFKRTDAN